MENDYNPFAAATSEWHLLRCGLLISWKQCKCLGLGSRFPVLISLSCPEFTKGVCTTHMLVAHFSFVSSVENSKGWERLITRSRILGKASA